jgi:hypothetical protein
VPNASSFFSQSPDPPPLSPLQELQVLQSKTWSSFDDHFKDANVVAQKVSFYIGKRRSRTKDHDTGEYRQFDLGYSFERKVFMDLMDEDHIVRSKGGQLYGAGECLLMYFAAKSWWE